MPISDTSLTPIAQQVMRVGERPWSPGWGGGILDAPAGGLGIVVRQGIPPRQVLPPKEAPRNEAGSLAQTVWHSTRWCHVMVGMGRWADALHAQVAYGVLAQPVLNRIFLGPRHTLRGAPRDGPLAGGGGPQL